MAAINVDKLPLKELLELEGRVKKAIVIAREREKGEVRQEMMALAAKRGLSLAEILGEWPRRRKGRQGRGEVPQSREHGRYLDRPGPAAEVAGRCPQEGRENQRFRALIPS